MKKKITEKQAQKLETIEKAKTQGWVSAYLSSYFWGSLKRAPTQAEVQYEYYKAHPKEKALIIERTIDMTRKPTFGKDGSVNFKETVTMERKLLNL